MIHTYTYGTANGNKHVEQRTSVQLKINTTRTLIRMYMHSLFCHYPKHVSVIILISMCHQLKYNNKYKVIKMTKPEKLRIVLIIYKYIK